MHRTMAAGILLASIVVAGLGVQTAQSANRGSQAAFKASADPVKAWTCTSPSPPGRGPDQLVVQSRRATLAGVRVEAAGLATKGCVTLYIAPAVGGRWRAHVVTVDASHGNGVSSLQVAGTDRSHIWVLAQGLPGAGQAPALLFRTTDGGRLWQAQPVTQGSPFPHSDVRLNLRFTSAADGWITDLNTFYGPPRVEVYRTTDGGATWSLAAFAVPAKYAASLGDATALPPVFQAAWQGTLRVTGTMSGKTTTLVYGTADGGATWFLETAGNGRMAN